MKLKEFFKSKFGKVCASALAVTSAISTMAMSAFAAEPSEGVSSAVTGVTTLFGDVTSVFTFTNIVSMLGIAIGAAAVLTLAWFGLRKVISMIQKALKKGRVSV